MGAGGPVPRPRPKHKGPYHTPLKYRQRAAARKAQAEALAADYDIEVAETEQEAGVAPAPAEAEGAPAPLGQPAAQARYAKRCGPNGVPGRNTPAFHNAEAGLMRMGPVGWFHQQQPVEQPATPTLSRVASPLPDSIDFRPVIPDFVLNPYTGPVPSLVSMTDEEFQNHIDERAYKPEQLGSPTVGTREKSPDPTGGLEMFDISLF